MTDAYNRAVKAQGDAAERAVRQALGDFFRENPAATAEEAREYAIELLRGAGDLYGAAASQAAYDLLQNVAYVDGVPMPDLGSWFYEADAEAIDRTAHYHAGKVVDGDVQGFIDQISAAARECAERGANETMSQAAQAQARRNGKGDKRGRRKGARTYGVHFARVPMGPETCGFCLMLASRGFVYLSEESAGEFSKFHRHCDCRIVPGTADTKVDGYDPAALYDRWKHPEKYEEKGADAPTTRQQLEQEARRVYIAKGGGMGLSAAEAAERFDLLVDGNTDAQLREYIQKHGGEYKKSEIIENAESFLYSSTDLDYETISASRVPAPKSYWDEKKKVVESIGGQFQIADEQWINHLKENKAWAVTYHDTAILPPDATRVEIAEETIHVRQNVERLNNELNTNEREAVNEYLAQVELLESAQEEGFSEAEIEITIHNRDRYFETAVELGLESYVEDTKNTSSWG